MSLTDLLIGQKGVIDYIDDECKNKLRLTELGFSKNTHITPLHKSFSGNICAYYVKGAVIAIRKEDAEKIYIEGEYL